MRAHSFDGDIDDDARVPFYRRWIAPNLTHATFVRIIPMGLTSSATVLDLTLPPFPVSRDIFQQRLLTLLHSTSSLQELGIHFQLQYSFRFALEAPVTLANIRTLKLFVPAGEELSLYAPQAFLAAVRFPNLTHLSLNVHCDRYAAQYCQDKDVALLSLLPDPDDHRQLASLELNVSLIETWSDPQAVPSLQLTKALSKARYLRNLVVKTDFDLTALGFANSDASASHVELPQLRRIEFRDCTNLRPGCLDAWIASLKFTGVWDSIAELAIHGCRFIVQESITDALWDEKVKFRTSY